MQFHFYIAIRATPINCAQTVSGPNCTNCAVSHTVYRDNRFPNQTVTTMSFGPYRLNSATVARGAGFAFAWGTTIANPCPGGSSPSMSCTSSSLYCAYVEPHVSVFRPGTAVGIMQYTIPSSVAGVRVKVHEQYYSTYQNR